MILTGFVDLFCKDMSKNYHRNRIFELKKKFKTDGGFVYLKYINDINQSCHTMLAGS